MLEGLIQITGKTQELEICQKCGKAKPFMVDHHPDRGKTPHHKVRWCVDCHRKFHENVPRRGELTNLMRRYRKIVMLRVSINNWMHGYERTTGQQYKTVEKIREELHSEESKLITLAVNLIKNELEILGEIKGLGPKAIAKIIAFGDPRWFDTLSSFLAFWGCQKSKMFKCSHYLKGISYDMVTRVFMARNKNYLSAYHFFKQNGLTSQSARNRVRTFLLKEIYCKLNNPKGFYTLLVNGIPLWFQNRKVGQRKLKKPFQTTNHINFSTQPCKLSR